VTIIAVSGASGFLGRHVSRELLARGHEVRAISRSLLGSGDLAAALAGATTVIHLAARVHVVRDNYVDPRPEFWRSNVAVTQALAVAAQRACVKRFIFVSSAGVLGATSPPEGFAEDAVPHPHDAYTASKLEAEQWLSSALSASMELVILRPPLIYGAGAPGNFARLLRLAVKGWPLPIGALRAPRSIVAVRNIVNLISALAADACRIHATMLVADRETISVAELFQTVARHAGHRLWLAPVPPALIRSVLAVAGRSDDVLRLSGPFVLRPRIAQLQFNWEPPYSQQGELRETVACELAAMQVQADRRDGDER
jgi:nucleoside-diphosphate-sugar epimerase